MGHYACDMRPELFDSDKPERKKQKHDALHALRVARVEIGRTISDPMWADHAEVSKRALKRWHEAIDAEIERLCRNKERS